MDPAVEAALSTDKVIDITTIGRKSGEARRIEIWFHFVEGHYFITGRPGPRSWFANLIANPEFTFHLKESAQADLPARARVISDPAERRYTFPPIVDDIGDNEDVDFWIAGAPLVEVEFVE